MYRVTRQYDALRLIRRDYRKLSFPHESSPPPINQPWGIAMTTTGILLWVCQYQLAVIATEPNSGVSEVVAGQDQLRANQVVYTPSEYGGRTGD